MEDKQTRQTEFCSRLNIPESADDSLKEIDLNRLP